MEDGQNNNLFRVFHEEHLVRKATRECASHDSMDAREPLRVPKNDTEYCVNAQEELGAEARNTILIPASAISASASGRTMSRRVIVGS